MKTLILLVYFFANTGWSYNLEHIKKSAVEQNIPVLVVNEILAYFLSHESQIENKNYVTFVDYRKPSSDERLILINASTGQVEKYLVAHGKNSGENYAENFSNIENSKMSSLGLYKVETPYIGEHGTSLTLSGLSKSNSNAKMRSIVIHSADYVSDQWIAQEGQLGRSWGCFAVNKNDFLKNIFDKIKNGSLLIAFK
jgi:hypothetical protein